LDEKNVNCVEEGSGKTVWLKTEKDYFAYARGINSVTDFNPLGYIVIYYYENDLCKIYSDISLSMNAQMFIIDNDVNVISNSQKDTLGKKLPNAYLLALRNNRNIFLGKGAFNNGNCYIVSRSINNGQWILVYQISEKEFNKEVVAVLNEVILITSACIVIITLFSFLLSSVLSKPIINLTKQMKLAQSGDYSGYIDYKYTDEVGELSHNFNEMLKSTNHLIRVVYEKELIKQRVELEYLKLQINPHFLYNTLEVINWTARSNGLEDVGVIAKALGDLMRKALDPNDFVTFREEVDVVNNYLVIQKFRYGDKINYSADIDTKIMDAKVPIFILQPIIENSIIHGIEPKLTQGNIKLTGVIDNNDILLTIEDDGVGIPESVLNSIMTDTESQVQSSMQCKIGLRNVKKRLQFIYGENCALTIESELGKMTKVIVRLPFETKHADT
jgi:two-component system sensor histidine kinase YesM